jgi:hypothetical protein
MPRRRTSRSTTCAAGRAAHRLDFAFPFAAAWLGRVVVGGYFVHGVAARTLARIKAIAEAAPR